MWKSVRRNAETFRENLHYEVKGGKDVAFWKDTWLGFGNLMTVFPSLFSLARNKDCSVAPQFSERTTRWRIRFEGRLEAEDRGDLQLLLASIDVSIAEVGPDTPKWDGGSDGTFSVKECYREIHCTGKKCDYAKHLGER